MMHHSVSPKFHAAGEKFRITSAVRIATRPYSAFGSSNLGDEFVRA